MSRNEFMSSAGKMIPRIILLFLLANMFLLDFAKAQTLKVKLSDDLVIGNNEGADEEYLFYAVQHVCTDSRYNIYVSDASMARIKVFNSEGTFIKSIGNRGQGPGEMQEVTCMTVNANDELIIVDRRNQRITQFSTTNEGFQTYPFPTKSFIEPMAILPINQRGYILDFYTKNNINPTYTSVGYQAHLLSKDFLRFEGSFISVYDIWDLNISFHRALLGIGHLSMTTVGDSVLVCTKRMYDGKLYYCLFAVGRKMQVLRGKPNATPGYELLNQKDYREASNSKLTFFYNGPAGKFSALVLRWGHGLTTLQNGHIIHFFSEIQENGEGRLIVEIYSIEEGARLIGWGRVINIPILAFREIFQILWIDRQDRLYVAYKAPEGFSVLRRMLLEYEIE